MIRVKIACHAEHAVDVRPRTPTDTSYFQLAALGG